MAYNNITYRVVGRYMDGKEISAYHFIGSNNESFIFNKENTIYMIGKGLIENMRISTCKGEVIIRGKGINLNKLPVYDESKNQYRNIEEQQGKNTDNKMAKLTIVKRIMCKTNCVGYVVKDVSGAERKLKREDVIKLVSERRISNAKLNRTIDPNTGLPTFALRGDGCALKKLPILILDESGRIIDPLINKNEVVIRAVRMKTGGMIKIPSAGMVKRFSAGDFIIVNASGELDMIPGEKFISNYVYDREHRQATCDYYLYRLEDYTIELYGSPEIRLTPEKVKVWAMAKHK